MCDVYIKHYNFVRACMCNMYTKQYICTFMYVSSQATNAVDGEKRTSSHGCPYYSIYIHANSFTVDLNDPIIVGSGRNYAYGLLNAIHQYLLLQYLLTDVQ